MPETDTAPQTEVTKTEAANNDTPSLLKLPPLVQQLLGYAGFAYVVGFVTLIANTAQYGVPVVEFARPLTVLVGVLPTAAFFLATILSRMVKKKYPEHEASPLQTAGDLLLFAISLAAARLILWYARAVFFWMELRIIASHTLSPEDIALDKWLNEHWLTIVLILTPIVVLSIAWHRAKKDWSVFAGMLRDYFFRYALTTVMFAVLVSYIRVAYPRWPQQFGFGRPSSVRLLMESESFHALSLPANAPDDGAASPTATEAKLRLSAPVELLFETDKEYIVRYSLNGSVRIVSIDAGSVKGKIWK